MSIIIRNILGFCFLVLIVSACDNSENQSEDNKIMNKNLPITEIPKEALYTVSNGRIFFGHQSVGANVINGMKSLSEQAGLELNIKELGSQPLQQQTVFAHSNIGENNDPKSKIDDFANQIRNLGDFKPQIAFMKFCYVDFNAQSNVAEVFNYYRDTIEILKKEKSDIVFVHLTVPLAAKSYTLKSRIKEIIGRHTWNDDTTNAKRGEFNNLILDTYSNEPVFDIARVESTYLNGKRESFIKDDKTYYRMVPDYTTDGGHLNSFGQQLVAKEMVEFLANIINTNNN